MPDSELQPGERIIDVASLATTAAVFNGAVLAALLTWVAKHGILVCVEMAVCGGLAGVVLGRLLGRALFPAEPGKVFVVRVGRRSLPYTLRSALAGGLSAALLAVVVSRCAAGTAPAVIAGCLALGTAAAVVMAFVSSLA